jgi:type II secretory pathway pseudopilin PulG
MAAGSRRYVKLTHYPKKGIMDKDQRSISMMPAKGRLAATLIALTLIGCSAGQPTAVLNGEAASSGGIRTEVIHDPTLNNMAAYQVPVPAKWHFQGALDQGGGNCVGLASGVFRATSPDGLSFAEQMPMLGWTWGTGVAARIPPNNGCLPLKSAMSARDFLKYLTATLNVAYVADYPLPAELQAKAQKSFDDAALPYAAQYAAMHQQPPKQTVQLAAAIVRYKNGTFEMKGRLGTEVTCTEMVNQGLRSTMRGMPDQPGWTTDQCRASVLYVAAPENQYDALLKLWDAPEMQPVGNPEWNREVIDRMRRMSAMRIQEMQAQAAVRDQQMNATAAAQRQASAQQFAHDQGVRQQMHEQFLATMQRGTDMSMARAAQVANTNHTIASDWVDYSLDRQTVLDPNTGQLSKVSSSSSYTWVNSSGHTSFQTNDVNADPNGTLQGTWTRQQVVHGDGSQ